MNEDPPGCEPSKCMACQEEFRADFDRIAGIVFPKAGVTERIAAKCTDFYRTIHDPCMNLGVPSGGNEPISTKEDIEDPVSAPETDDPAAAGNYMRTKLVAMVVTLFGTALVFV